MSEIEKQFKNALISFLDELIGQFPNEGDLVIFRIFLKDRIPISTVLNYSVLKILPLKKMITDRDEDFFLNHCSLFESIEIDSKNDKKVIWQWFDSFIFLSEKYQKSLIKTPIIESK